MFFDIIEMLFAFSIPLTAIGGTIFLISKRIEAKKLDTEERQVLLQLKSENAALKRRIDSIETIVSEIDGDMLLLNRQAPSTPPPTPEIDTTQQNIHRIEEMRKKIERGD